MAFGAEAAAGAVVAFGAVVAVVAVMAVVAVGAVMAVGTVILVHLHCPLIGTFLGVPRNANIAFFSLCAFIFHISLLFKTTRRTFQRDANDIREISRLQELPFQFIMIDDE